jgi:cell wall-associated NlpC family hydrolase
MARYSLFPRLLAVCCVITFSALTAIAQTDDTRPRQVAIPTTQSMVSTAEGGAPRLETDAVIISVAELAPPTTSSSTAPVAPHSAFSSRLAHLDQLLHTAIDTRLGAPYVWGASGPNRFDCSGFVWSVFQSAGIRFERTSARTLWSRFQPASQEDRTRFGTLVFFNNLTHVGIVADERGFYHASTSRGVVYSTFNSYWSSRIDGYRRVPVEEILMAE